jgi:hypothetical protein
VPLNDCNKAAEARFVLKISAVCHNSRDLVFEINGG